MHTDNTRGTPHEFRYPDRPSGLRVRHDRHAGAEQPDADGVWRELRLPPDLAAHARHRWGFVRDGSAGWIGADGVIRRIACAELGAEGRLRLLPALARIENRDGCSHCRAGRGQSSDDLSSSGRFPVGEPQGLGHVPVRHHALRARPHASVGRNRGWCVRGRLLSGDFCLGMARDRGPAMAVKRNSAKGLQHHYGSFTGGVALSRARARKLTFELPNLALARCN